MSLFRYQYWSSATSIRFTTKTQLRLGHPRFPALHAVCLFLLRVRIRCLPVIFFFLCQFGFWDCFGFWFHDAQSKIALMWHTIRTSFTHRTHLQRLILVEPRTYVTYDPNVTRDLLHRWFFSKLEGDLSSEGVGFKFSPEVRFPSFLR